MSKCNIVKVIDMCSVLLLLRIAWWPDVEFPREAIEWKETRFYKQIIDILPMFFYVFLFIVKARVLSKHKDLISV